MANEQAGKPFLSSIPEGVLIKARKMREVKTSYQKIADILGVNLSTLRYALDSTVREQRKKYAENNREKINARKKKYCKSHTKEIAAYMKDYREDHKQEIAESNKKYNKDHREEIAIVTKKWRENNKESIAEYNKQYYKDNREEELKRCQKYKKEHPEKRSAWEAKRRALIAGTTAGNLDEITEIYRIAAEEPNIQCYICGKLSQVGDRAVDHIFPVSGGYPTVLSNLAITHAGCNGEKRDKMPEELNIYDRTVVEHARRGNNLVIFHNLSNLIISSTKN